MGSLGSRLSRVFDRLREPLASNQRRQGEAILAFARVGLAAGCCVAVYADFGPASPHRTLIFTLALSYLLVSVIFVTGQRAADNPRLGFQCATLAVDLICPTLVCLLSGGPNGAVIAIYLLAALSAAYRWGFVETLGTASGSILLVWLTRVVPVWDSRGALHLPAPHASTSTFIGHAICLLFLAALLGYLAEREKSFRVHVLAVGQVLTRASSEAGLLETIEHALRAIQMLTAAGELRLVVREERTGKANVWTLTRAAATADDSFRFATLPLSEHEQYFFEAPERSWHTAPGRKVGDNGMYRCLVIDADGNRLPDQTVPLAEAFFRQQPFRSVLVVNFAIADDWSGRLFVLNSETVISPHAELSFLQSLGWAALPSIHNAYLLRRLRTRVRTQERKRIAGELHDGLLQSLIALEMDLAVLRRRNGSEAPVAANELERFQRQLHEEILDTRTAMERLKLQEMSPRQMISAMTEMVTRFERETGIRASFVCDSPRIELPAFMCREIAGILQEALANVRKHSGATSVRVHFGLEDKGWKLSIADDGRGFEFSGRQSQTDLDRRHRGPAVLRERARAIGAQLEIASDPGHGACVEVHLQLHETYV